LAGDCRGSVAAVFHARQRLSAPNSELIIARPETRTTTHYSQKKWLMSEIRVDRCKNTTVFLLVDDPELG
jgi:hypothetical protein